MRNESYYKYNPVSLATWGKYRKAMGFYEWEHEKVLVEDASGKVKKYLFFRASLTSAWDVLMNGNETKEYYEYHEVKDSTFKKICRKYDWDYNEFERVNVKGSNKFRFVIK